MEIFLWRIGTGTNFRISELSYGNFVSFQHTLLLSDNSLYCRARFLVISVSLMSGFSPLKVCRCSLVKRNKAEMGFFGLRREEDWAGIGDGGRGKCATQKPAGYIHLIRCHC